MSPAYPTLNPVTNTLEPSGLRAMETAMSTEFPGPVVARFAVYMDTDWMSGGMMQATRGDRIIVTAAKTEGATREGEILEVIEGDLRIRYRV